MLPFRIVDIRTNAVATPHNSQLDIGSGIFIGCISIVPHYQECYLIPGIIIPNCIVVENYVPVHEGRMNG